MSPWLVKAAAVSRDSVVGNLVDVLDRGRDPLGVRSRQRGWRTRESNSEAQESRLDSLPHADHGARGLDAGNPGQRPVAQSTPPLGVGEVDPCERDVDQHLPGSG